MKNTFKFLGIITIAAIIVFSFVSCGALDLFGKEEKKEQTEEPKKEQPGGEEPGGNQPGNQPGGNQPGGNNPGGGQPGGNPGGEIPGEGEEPGGNQEQAKAQSGTIQMGTVAISVTGNMTDAQWQIGFPELQNEFNAARYDGNSVDNRGVFNVVFNTNDARTIVLEWKPGYNYKADALGTPNAKIYLNVEVITAANILAAATDARYDGGQAKVDARDTVRMAKAPVNGKAFAAGIFAQLPQSRAAISQKLALDRESRKSA